MSLLGAGVEAVTRYRFVDSREADGFPGTAACRAAGVSTSAYDDWRRAQHREPSPAQQAEAAPDLLGRNFTPGLADRRWVGDITDVPTDEGWLYLAAVLDVGSRRVLGSAMVSHLRTGLVADCLDTAVATRGGDVAGVIFPSDRGCQYTSVQFAQHCRELGIHRALDRTGICWDCETVLRRPRWSDPCYDRPVSVLALISRVAWCGQLRMRRRIFQLVSWACSFAGAAVAGRGRS
ncbi:hypothetical protein GCM10027174_46070 [Salinifilum aidingensis]